MYLENQVRVTTTLCNISARDNPKYRANVNRLANLFAAGRPPPLDDAAWLMEFVAATRGAQHLKIASRNLSLVQLFCLDVAFVAAVLSVAAVGILKWILGVLARLWRMYRLINKSNVEKEKKMK